MAFQNWWVLLSLVGLLELLSWWCVFKNRNLVFEWVDFNLVRLNSLFFWSTLKQLFFQTSFFSFVLFDRNSNILKYFLVGMLKVLNVIAQGGDFSFKFLHLLFQLLRVNMTFRKLRHGDMDVLIGFLVLHLQEWDDVSFWFLNLFDLVKATLHCFELLTCLHHLLRVFLNQLFPKLLFNWQFSHDGIILILCDRQLFSSLVEFCSKSINNLVSSLLFASISDSNVRSLSENDELIHLFLKLLEQEFV